jgi:hypothetical protein
MKVDKQGVGVVNWGPPGLLAEYSMQVRSPWVGWISNTFS